MSDNDVIFQIALTKIRHIGSYHARTLLAHFETAEEIFSTPKRFLEKIEGIGSVRASQIRAFRDFQQCEADIKKIEREKIKVLFIKNKEYPQRLSEVYDAPILLYYKGTANLNHSKIVSIVGTRSNSSYGKYICETIIATLSKFSVIVVSGLAYGIDTIAHQCALKNNLESIAILAHGLDTIYPYSNRSLSNQLVAKGGLLTDFCLGTPPDKPNFPKRNRITAAICDALIVIETGIKGGSLITASLANSYNKEVFAVPGRINDPQHEGCNYLIKENKAMIIAHPNDIAKELGWEKHSSTNKQTQLTIDFELNEEEIAILHLFKKQSPIHIDIIYRECVLTPQQILNNLLHLEMKNVIKSLPGNQYSIM